MVSNEEIQQQLIAARRQQILDAAASVFAAKGYHRASVRDVAQGAGVADGTIYNYFGGKADLLMGLLNRLNESEARPQHFAPDADMDIRAFLREYLRHRFGVMLGEGDVFRAVLPELITNAELRQHYMESVLMPTMRLAEGFIAHLAASGQIVAPQVPLTARVLGGAVFGVLLLYLMGDPALEADWDQLPAILADTLCDGLLPRQEE